MILLKPVVIYYC